MDNCIVFEIESCHAKVGEEVSHYQYIIRQNKMVFTVFCVLSDYFFLVKLFELFVFNGMPLA